MRKLIYGGVALLMALTAFENSLKAATVVPLLSDACAACAASRHAELAGKQKKIIYCTQADFYGKNKEMCSILHHCLKSEACRDKCAGATLPR